MGKILHTVNQSPFSHRALKNCLDRIQLGDSILLLENGVYGALAAQPWALQMNPAFQFYAIKEDIDARGLNTNLLLSHISLIDYTAFVQLSVEHTLVHSWY